MTMRRYLIPFVLAIFFLSACQAQAASPTQPSVPARMVKTTQVEFSLGKCIDARQPTPNPGDSSLFPKVGDQDHVQGVTNPSVTILVYSDFQCVSCANLANLLKSLVAKYPNDLRLVFRNFPLISLHDKAALAAQAAEAASLQGKFWIMHDFLFANQSQWSSLKPGDFQKWIIQQSSSQGLDQNRFEADFSSPKIVDLINKAWDDGQKIKIPGTPLILINGEIIKWQANLLDQLEYLVRLSMLAKKQFTTCPTLVINPSKQYTAILKTSQGDIVIKLFADQAPNSVNNFVFLARNGWFDKNPIINNYPGFDFLSGDPSGTGLGGPGYFISDEQNNLLFDRSGMVAYLNSGPQTNGSRFFITLAPSSKYNSQFTIFGQVTSGMDVVSRLVTQSGLHQSTQTPTDAINSVIIEEK